MVQPRAEVIWPRRDVWANRNVIPEPYPLSRVPLLPLAEIAIRLAPALSSLIKQVIVEVLAAQ